MVLVAFLRGVNVGGHRTFRPSLLAQELDQFDVVNIGAAGTLVVRKPGTVASFRSALIARLPFSTEVVLCRGSELTRLIESDPFGGGYEASPEVVHFVSVLGEAKPLLPSLPLQLPSDGEWLVRVVERRGSFVLGEYRRHMRTIGYLGQLDKLFGAKATTRNWNTILAVARVLNQSRKGA